MITTNNLNTVNNILIGVDLENIECTSFPEPPSVNRTETEQKLITLERNLLDASECFMLEMNRIKDTPLTIDFSYAIALLSEFKRIGNETICFSEINLSVEKSIDRVQEIRKWTDSLMNFFNKILMTNLKKLEGKRNEVHNNLLLLLSGFHNTLTMSHLGDILCRADELLSELETHQKDIVSFLTNNGYPKRAKQVEASGKETVVSLGQEIELKSSFEKLNILMNIADPSVLTSLEEMIQDYPLSEELATVYGNVFRYIETKGGDSDLTTIRLLLPKRNPFVFSNLARELEEKFKQIEEENLDPEAATSLCNKLRQLVEDWMICKNQRIADLQNNQAEQASLQKSSNEIEKRHSKGLKRLENEIVLSIDETLEIRDESLDSYVLACLEQLIFNFPLSVRSVIAYHKVSERLESTTARLHLKEIEEFLKQKTPFVDMDVQQGSQSTNTYKITGESPLIHLSARYLELLRGKSGKNNLNWLHNRNHMSLLGFASVNSQSLKHKELSLKFNSLDPSFLIKEIVKYASGDTVLCSDLIELVSGRGKLTTEKLLHIAITMRSYFLDAKADVDGLLFFNRIGIQATAQKETIVTLC